jgi:hypothetical protein
MPSGVLSIHRRVAAMLVVVGLVATSCGGGGKGGSDTPVVTPKVKVTIPASVYRQFTWGIVGCSNTHDTIWGYHQVPDSDHTFWPFQGYHIEGTTVIDWSNPADPHWPLFEQFVRRYDGGASPPVIWFQMCESLDPRSGTYGITTYDDVRTVLAHIHQLAPQAIVFISPLQAYQPADMCVLMGPNGESIQRQIDFGNRAVADGLAEPGPGISGNPNLGPLTPDTTVEDRCHPTGGPHGPGDGAIELGQQLNEFFHALKG